MSGFKLKNKRWHADGVPLTTIADKVGTPCYVYSLTAFEERFREIDNAYRTVPRLVAYALKANDNLSVIRALAKLGAGADIVSGGELYKARLAGVPADRIIYAGVGKTDEEIRYALKEKIRYFNVESIPEIHAINEVAARLGKTAPIAVRFNPDVDPHTHHYITTGKKETKFGIDLNDLPKIVRAVRECRSVHWTAVHAHIGSQMTQTGPVGLAAGVLEKLVVRLREEGFAIHTLNLGGGYGIDYEGKAAPRAAQYAAKVIPVLKRLRVSLILEPGRFISGNSGVLLTRVLFVKKSGSKTFYIVDAGMTELIRPSLYEAYHRIEPVEGSQKPVQKVDVVGPICESGDFLAKDRKLPLVERGDLLAVFSAGAYGRVMGSTYNARPLPAEVAVRGTRFKVVRERQTLRDLVRLESIS